jgi:hypothetical protein
LFLVYTVFTTVDALALIIARAWTSAPRLMPMEMACMWVTGTMLLPTTIMVSCLLFYHLGILVENQTTIEVHGLSLRHQTHFQRRSQPQTKPISYDLGTTSNLVAVFGHLPLCWCCPTAPTGDGCSFPVPPGSPHAKMEHQGLLEVDVKQTVDDSPDILSVRAVEV